MNPLPIDPHLPRILDCLKAGHDLILQATPGSGKTTRVPPAILDTDLVSPEQDVVVLVPRRLAAKMAALRVAEERGEEVGGTIGYQFRFESKVSSATRLRFLTEGMLIRQLQSNPTLAQTGCVILDEFHERHLHTDVALAYLTLLKRNTRPDLKLVIMSATLETEALARYLKNTEVIQIASAQYPVAIHYAVQNSKRRLDEDVCHAVNGIQFASSSKHQDERQDVLVFLPGMANIRRAADALEARFPGRFVILPLHGDLPREEQALVFAATEKPKIILATNVAETSLTIPGVHTVIDSGLHREASYSWWSGVPSLKTRPISKAAAIQRTGRAGRMSPGQCLRLYTESDLGGRSEFTTPEIRRADLTQTLLEIKALGVVALTDFPWFEAPQPAALTASLELLFYLGALESAALDAKLTPIGKAMAVLPLHPRLSRVMIAAEKYGVTETAARLVALISEGELEDLDALESLQKNFVSEAVKKLTRQILSHFKLNASKTAQNENLGRVLLCGFPDRVAKKREYQKKSVTIRAEEDLVFSFGGSGTVANVDVVRESEMFLVLDVQERQGTTQARPRVHVKSLCAIRADWLLDLETALISEVEELTWDTNKQRVVELTQLCYGQIILTESRGEPRDAVSATHVLLKSALGLDAEKLATLNPVGFLTALEPVTDAIALATLLARLDLLQRHHPQAGLTELFSENFGAHVVTLLNGAIALEDLCADNIREKIFSNLPYDVPHLLDRETPTHVTLTGGRHAAVIYEFGQSPRIESRLQDFFGMREGPKILGGRVPITLHLLAPNRRAMQVTSDLASFWKTTYPKIRTQLARRYPRHKWPENPL